MATLEERLALWGIRRPEITVRAARDAGLEVAAACAVLVKESGGGRMVWGSDGKPTARRTDAQGRVIYEFGGPVTAENFLRFRAAQRAGLIPRQGVGDCQLTSEPYVAEAEVIGGPSGPADPYSNQRAGFAGLARLVKRYGLENGFAAYNGGPGALSRPASHPARVYGAKAVGQVATWRDRLAGTVPAPSAPAAAPVIPRGDEFDMASLDDLRKIVREEAGPRVTWDWPVHNYFTDDPADTMPAFATLSWAATHGAHARADVGALRLELATLRGALAKTATATEGGAQLAPADVERMMRAALAEVGPLYLTGRDPAA